MHPCGLAGHGENGVLLRWECTGESVEEEQPDLIYITLIALRQCSVEIVGSTRETTRMLL